VEAFDKTYLRLIPKLFRKLDEDLKIRRHVEVGNGVFLPVWQLGLKHHIRILQHTNAERAECELGFDQCAISSQHVDAIFAVKDVGNRLVK
jgi:hypothetical protein